jgi:hypothetical protein
MCLSERLQPPYIFPENFLIFKPNTKLLIMRKLFTLLIIMLLWAGNSWGQVPIGTGTSNLNLPIYPYFGYSYSQVLYLQSEIAATGNITSLQFYFNGATLSNSNNWTIYMGHTSKTAFASTTDWIPVASMTQVYSGTFANPTGAGWITFDITDFAYNNVSNLVIAIDENAAGYNGSGDYFRSTASTPGRAILFYSDLTNPDPSAPPTASTLVSAYANIILDGITQTPCAAPANQPTNLVLTPYTTTVNGSFTAAPGSDSYLVLRSTVATPTATPVNGTNYTAGTVLGNDTVVYAGNLTTFSSTGLKSGLTYYFFVYSMNSIGCSGGPVYLTSPAALTGSTTTAPPDPATFTATAASSSQVNLTATANSAGSNIMVAWNTANTFGTPSGTLNIGDPITGGGTVLWVGAAASLPNHTGRSAGTTYYYKAWSNAGTAYSNPGLTANATTFFTIPYLQDFNASTSLPTGWSGSFFVGAAHGTSGSNGLCTNLYSYNLNANAVAPNVILSANPCRLVLDYRIVNYTGYPSTGTTLTAGDSINVAVSTDGGTTYTIIHTIKQANHVTSASFATILLPLTGYASQTIKVRLYAYRAAGDYYVDFDNFRIEEVPSCAYPTNVAVSTITNTSAFVGWVGAANVQVDYGAVGHAAGTGTVSPTTSTNPYPLTGLTPFTSYDVFVRQDCGSGSYSPWTGPVTFKTECDPITDFAEGFDKPIAPVLPDCWKMFSSYVYGTVTTITTAPHSAPNCAQLYNSGSLLTDNILLITPYLSNLGSGTNQLRFWAKASSVLANSVVIGTMTDPLNGATFTALQTVTGLSTSAWTEFTVSFGLYSGSNKYIAFRHPATSTYSNIYIDDVAWEPLPACPQPSALTTTNITDVSARLDWAPGLTETLWKVKYGPVGFDPNTAGTLIAGITSHPYDLNPPLTANTTYSWYVQADCVSDTSLWSGPKTFTTALCAPANKCTYTVDLVDSYGDGWNGNILGFKQGGAIVATFGEGFTTGTTYGPVNAPLCDLLSTEIVVSTLGLYTDEVGFTVKDPFGVVVFSRSPGSTFTSTTIFSTFTTNCTPPACPPPTALAATTTATTANLSWTPGGSEPTWQYKYGLSPLPTPTTAGTVTTSSSTNPISGLTANTAYQFYVRAMCSNGDSSQWVGPQTFITPCAASSLPFTEGFDGTPFPPACWGIYSGLLADPSVLIPATGYWIQDDWRNIAGAEKAARLNIWSTTTKHWLTTPPLALLPGVAYQVAFDLSLNAYGTSAAPQLTGVDDKFAVVISTDGGSTWSSARTLRLWDNAGSPYVYNNINYLGERITLPISSVSGTIKIGFYGESTVSNADNDLMINNLVVSEVFAHDVGTVSIDNVPSSVLLGTVVTPKATVQNYGSNTESFNVTMTTTGYTSTQAVTDLAPNATAQVTFTPFTPAEGTFSLQACTELGTDMNISNDCKTLPLLVTRAIWTTGTAVPTGTYLGTGVGHVDSTVVPHVGYLFSIGGNSTLGTECNKYNVNTNTWSPIASLPSKRVVMASAIAGNKIYVIGGSDGATTPVYTNTVYCYDITAGTWTTKAPLPKTIAWGKAVSYSTNFIYLAGGVDAATAGKVLSNVYIYDVSLDTWTVADSMPGPKFGGAFSRAGDKLVYVAGANATVISDVVYVGTISGANPANISWTTADNPYPGSIGEPSNEYVEDMAGTTAVHSGIVNNNRIAYPGGAMYRFDGAPWGTDGIIVAAGSPTGAWSPAVPNPCYVFQPATGIWTIKPNVPVAVLGPSLGSVDLNSFGTHTWKLIVATGYTGAVVTTATQILSETFTGPCFVPSALTVTNVTNSAADINWTETGGATTWQLEYGLAGFSHGSGTLITGITVKPKHLTGLTGNTAYDVYVKADCGYGNTSDWSTVQQFTTLCDPIATLPYVQNFDAVAIPALPACWTKYSSAAGTPWVSADQATTFVPPLSAPNFMYVTYNADLPKDEWLLTPGFQLNAGTEYRVKFWVQAPGTVDPEKLKLVVTTDPSLSGVIGGEVLWNGDSLMLSDYTEFVATYIPATSGAYYFAWHAYSAADVDFIAMDDVTIEVAPPCLIPSGVAASAITATSATISWTAPSPAPGNGYQYEVRTSGAAGSGEVGLAVGGSTLNTYADISDLTSPTTYHVYVRANCGDNVYSNWTADYTFSTVEPLGVSGIVTDASCNWMDDGAIATTVTGGAAPYGYLWSNGETTPSLMNLWAGNYTVTVTDAYMSSVTGSWTVLAPSEMSVMGEPTPASCPNASDGSVTVSVLGGTPPYTYLWSTGATTPSISNLAPGNYYVTVNDASICGPSMTEVMVSVLSLVCENLSVTGDITTVECYDALNTITVAGGNTTFVVEPTGRVRFIAGVKIRYLEGTTVMSGGYMLGKITLTAEFCSATKMTEVAGGKVEVPPVTERTFFSLFPNPTNGNFTLVQKGDRNYSNVKVEVYSMSGEKVLTESMIGETRHEFRFSDMSTGLYFVKVVADDYVETIKLVKTR